MPIAWECEGCGRTCVDEEAVAVEVEPRAPPDGEPWEVCERLVWLCRDCVAALKGGEQR